MEYYWTLFNNSSNASTTANQGQNCNNHPPAWDLPTSTTSSASRPDLGYYPPPSAAVREMFHDAGHSTTTSSSSSSSSSSSLYCNPDPQLTCLKLGKRNYFEDLTPPPRFSMTKKTKSCGGAAADVAPPMCQVEGCAAVLVNAKDYHRRHKVCEMHAKAPKVVVVGIEQRFCQQCSRFHAVAEFDEAKRSCRRRLAGHNERRRKSSQEQNYLARKHHNDIEMMVAQPHLLSSSECALSLLSPTNHSQWNGSTTSHDLPASCSAALRELIAENRDSAFFACGQFINANHQTSWDASGRPGNRGHVTLNLMHGQDSGFGVRPGHSSEEDGDGDCPEFWNFPLGF